MFGSNGHIKQPKSVIKSFTKRESYHNRKIKICCKSIIRSSAIHKIHCHSHILKPLYKSINCVNKVDNVKDFIYNSDENSLFWNQLACNHYQLQSKEWFLNVKCTRGDAMNEFNGRNAERRDYKLNDVKDEELKNKKY